MKRTPQKCAYCGSVIEPTGQRHPTDWGIVCAYCFDHVWQPKAAAKRPATKKQSPDGFGEE